MPRSQLSMRRCDSRFPHEARRFVHAVLERNGLVDAADAIDLLVSEVVTYAVVGGEFDHASLDLRLDDDSVRVEVTDPTSYLAAVVADMPLDHTLRAGGIGLLMVDQLARSWGVDPAGDGTMIWFEVDLASARRAQLDQAGTAQ